jgi:hypothetical protein
VDAGLEYQGAALKGEYIGQHRDGGGVNVEFAGGKVRLLADYVSRRIGMPGVRSGLLVTQAQVKF